MLEYAAHAAQTWTGEELRRTFEEHARAQGRDPGEILGHLLQTDEKPDADSFWRTVHTNLAAERLRLLFVADEIPDPLQRVVEFLNRHMSDIDVLAVEIKQFRGQSVQTLVPRVLGRTAKPPNKGQGSPRPKMTRELFLGDFVDDEVREAPSRLLNLAERSGATFEWGASGVSIRGKCTRWQQPITVAWLYPPSKADMGWMQTRDFTFGAAILDYDPGPDDEVRAVLRNWVNSFINDSFAKSASSKGVTAWSIDYATATQHIDVLAERLTRVLEELRAL